MAYATVTDVQARMTRALSTAEESVCGYLLDDAAEIIGAVAPDALVSAKKTVSCRMVIRALGDGSASAMGAPTGASQGSISALGYAQSWTMGSGGSVGELYLTRTDKLLLGLSDNIGASNPLMARPPL